MSVSAGTINKQTNKIRKKHTAGSQLQASVYGILPQFGGRVPEEKDQDTACAGRSTLLTTPSFTQKTVAESMQRVEQEHRKILM